MSAAWVACGVRARALLSRRLGSAGARRLAGSPSLTEALHTLASGPYRHDVRVGQSLAAAQRAVAATLLWHLRVLVGWQPRGGVEQVRLLAGWFELANVVEHLRGLAGLPAEPPFRLGALATVWPRLAGATSAAQVRDTLAASVWSDPGGATPAAVAAGMAVRWGDRVAAGVPDAAGWAAAGVALLVARERYLAGRALPGSASRVAGQVLGVDPSAPGSLPDFAGRLPAAARWALAGVREPAGLWQAEAGWWSRVEQDGFALLRRRGFGPPAVIGCVAVLAADAWRVRAALEIAARGGRPVEAFDAVG